MSDAPMNPSAFPTDDRHTVRGELCEYHGGMTLRDYFAGQALAGMLALPETLSWGNFHSNGTKQDAANYAYQFADAMLAERASSQAGEQP